MSDRNRGFALLVTLWSLVLLALLLLRLAGAAHGEMQVAGNVRVAAELEAQADGLVFAAIARLARAAPAAQMADGADHPQAIAGGTAVVRVEDLSGRINPNVVSAPLLQAFLHEAGLAPAAADALAAAIAAWRAPRGDPIAAGFRADGWPFAPAGKPFRRLEELLEVPGTTPALLAALAPHLTLDYPGDPVAAHADAIVARALAAFPPPVPVEGAGLYAEIRVRVTRSDGAAFARTAVAWAGPAAQRGFRILRWDIRP